MSADDLLVNYHDAVIYPSDLALLDSPTDWLNDACINFHMRRLQHTQDETRDAGKEGGRDPKRQKKGIEGIDQFEDLFLDPSVVSFLVHQLTEDDDDFDKELLNLNASWNLPQSPTSGHDVDGMKKVGEGNLRAQKLMHTHSRKRIFVPISDQFGESKAAFARPGGGSHWSILLWEVNSLYYETNEGFNALVGVGFYSFDSSRGVNKTAAEVVAKKLHKVLCASMSPHDGVADLVRVVECQTPQQQNGYDCGLFALGFAEALSGTDEHFIVKEDCESFLQGHFEKNGGHRDFALRLRRKIGDAIRESGGVTSYVE